MLQVCHKYIYMTSVFANWMHVLGKLKHEIEQVLP